MNVSTSLNLNNNSNKHVEENVSKNLNEKKIATKGLTDYIFALNKEAKQEAQLYENQTLIKQIIRAFCDQHRLYLGHDDSITGLFLLSQTEFISASTDGTLRKWDLINRDFKILETQEKKAPPLTSLMRLNKDQVVLGYQTGALMILDHKENKTKVLNHSEKPIQAIYRVTDTTFMSNDQDTLKIWNVNLLDSNQATLKEKGVTSSSRWMILQTNVSE
jgi:WD40 repeat protein